MKDKFSRVARYVDNCSPMQKAIALTLTAALLPGGLIFVAGLFLHKYDVKNKIQKRYRAFKSGN